MTFFERLKFLLGMVPKQTWADELDIKSGIGERGMTVHQLHAQLQTLIDEGLGGAEIAVDAAYVEGLLCGHPAAGIAGLAKHRALGTLGVQIGISTHKSLCHISKGTLQAVARYDALRGAWT